MVSVDGDDACADGEEVLVNMKFIPAVAGVISEHWVGTMFTNRQALNAIRIDA